MSRPTVWIPSGTTSDAKNSPPFQSKSQPASELEAFTFPVPQPKKPEPRVNPQPERVRFHCEHCWRDGHLAEFCYRRKRAERRERQWRNQDLYHPVHGVHSLGSFLLRVVLRESSIDVKERVVRALDVIQAMVNMVLRVTAVALDRQGSTDHVSPRVVIALKGEAILWM